MGSVPAVWHTAARQPLGSLYYTDTSLPDLNPDLVGRHALPHTVALC